MRWWLGATLVLTAICGGYLGLVMATSWSMRACGDCATKFPRAFLGRRLPYLMGR